MNLTRRVLAWAVWGCPRDVLFRLGSCRIGPGFGELGRLPPSSMELVLGFELVSHFRGTLCALCAQKTGKSREN